MLKITLHCASPVYGKEASAQLHLEFVPRAALACAALTRLDL